MPVLHLEETPVWVGKDEEEAVAVALVDEDLAATQT